MSKEQLQEHLNSLGYVTNIENGILMVNLESKKQEKQLKSDISMTSYHSTYGFRYKK